MKETVTLDEVLQVVNQRKDTSRRQLFRYLNRLGIKRVSAFRTRPALYPADTAARVLTEGLGARLVTLNELRAAREKANRARRPEKARAK